MLIESKSSVVKVVSSFKNPSLSVLDSPATAGLFIEVAVMSFARINFREGMGFNAVPRWFRASIFWNKLSLAHRGILDEIFHEVRRLPYVWKDQIAVQRGQCVITLTRLASHCGASKQQVRDILGKAKKEQILTAETKTWSKAGLTHRITLITWLDFELYDQPAEHTNTSINTSTNTSTTTSINISTNTNKTAEPYREPSDNASYSEAREGAAVPLGGGQAADPSPFGGDAFSTVVNAQGSPAPEGNHDGEYRSDDGESSSEAPAEGKSSPRDSRGDYELDEAGKAAVLASVGNMEMFLLYGSAGLEPGADRIPPPPAATNWRVHQSRNDRGDVTDMGVERWSIPQTAAYYWFLVSRHRSKNGIPLTLPERGRLMGVVRNTLATMTAAQMHTFICTVTQHFDLIKFQLRNIGASLNLDETSLSHSLVRQAAYNLAIQPQEVLEQMYVQMQQGENLLANSQ